MSSKPLMPDAQRTAEATRDAVAPQYSRGTQPPIRKILKIVTVLGLSALILAGLSIALDHQPAHAQPISPNLDKSSKAG
jgi:hypothetical protein